MKNNNIRDYFIASPFSRNTNFKGKLKEKEFFERYFIGGNDDTYKEVNGNLINALDNPTNQMIPRSIFLTGFKGTGKTTFLKWFAREKLKNYNVIFFDLNDRIGLNEDDENENEISIFKDFFRSELDLTFFNHKDKLTQLFEFLKNNKYNGIRNKFSNSFWDYLEIAIKNKNESIKDKDYENTVDNSSYKDLNILLLLFIFKFPNEFSILNKFKYIADNPFIIIYDNIDHIKVEHFNSEFPRFIETTHNSLQDILQLEISSNNSNKNISTLYFIYCLRDSNCSIVNRQLADIPERWDVRFRPNFRENDIIQRRIKIAREDNIILNEKQIEFLSYIFEDRYTSKTFAPLFNYNLRKLSSAFVDILNCAKSKDVYIDQVKELASGEEKDITITGSRGINFFFLIEQLTGNEYLSPNIFTENISIGNNGGELTPARIILTIIHNFTQFRIDQQEQKFKSDPIELKTVYEEYRKFFRKETDIKNFFRLITKLFMLHSKNWCHLISFSGKYIHNIDHFKEEYENALNDDLVLLSNIKVQVTPAAYIYLKDIMKHYEFFSIRAHNTKPLFANNRFSVGKNKRLNLSSIKDIKSTFEVVEPCIKSLNDFLLTEEGEDFEDSGACFKLYDWDSDDGYYEGGQKTVYIIRILHTHIDYIDRYRYYLLNINPETSILQDEFKQNINEDLVKIIKQYVNLLSETKTAESYIESLVSSFEKKIKTIENKEFFDFNTVINPGIKN